jgi:glycogen debranching enzyme
LNAYLILQYDHLAKMAAEIGLSDDAQRWTREAEAMTRRLIDLRWDEEMGLFPSMRGDQRIDVLTPLSLFPLITGRMPKPIADRLVAHLSDEKTFWTHFPVPTVAQNDPKHDPMTMWRGPVWVNINYLLIDGLLRAGYPDVARQLRRRTLDMVMGANDIYEYYHPVTGEKPPRAVSTFGWSSALFIDLVLQEIADEA